MSWSQIARRIRVPMGFLFAAVFLMHLYYAGPTYLSLSLSLLLVVPGLLLRAYASGYVKKNSELAMTGPYAYTRNPLYLGSIMIAFGFAAASRSWLITGLLAVLFAVIYVPTILSEEAFLRSAFASFDDYAKSVPRLFPRVIPAKPSDNAKAHGGGFSSDLYMKHREYNAALGVVAVYLAMLMRMFVGPHQH